MATTKFSFYIISTSDRGDFPRIIVIALYYIYLFGISYVRQYVCLRVSMVFSSILAPPFNLELSYLKHDYLKKKGLTNFEIHFFQKLLLFFFKIVCKLEEPLCQKQMKQEANSLCTKTDTSKKRLLGNSFDKQ